MTPLPPSDLRILITGGARGIGAAVARDLHAQGAQVLITDVLDDEGAALAATLGARALYQRLDVTRQEDWAAAVATAGRAFGGLNALFNNAGIVQFAGVADCAPDDWRRVIDINLTGAFLGIRACAAALAQAGGGVIVNTSSTAGLQGYAGLAAYVASKWGLTGLTRAAALDLAPRGTRVLSLHPGPIRTPMVEGLPDAMAARQPIPRFGEVDEVARMVRFLLCEASYSTGSAFVIDGGALVGQLEPVGAEPGHAEGP
jgi:3alpha(or 20beta)-hydroxysteroid dehydrogenase